MKKRILLEKIAIMLATIGITFLMVLLLTWIGINIKIGSEFAKGIIIGISMSVFGYAWGSGKWISLILKLIPAVLIALLIESIFKTSIIGILHPSIELIRKISIIWLIFPYLLGLIIAIISLQLFPNKLFPNFVPPVV